MKAIISPVTIKFYTNNESKQDDLLAILMQVPVLYWINSDGYIICRSENSCKLWKILLTVCEHMKVEIIETQY